MVAGSGKGRTGSKDLQEVHEQVAAAIDSLLLGTDVKLRKDAWTALLRGGRTAPDLALTAVAGVETSPASSWLGVELQCALRRSPFVNGEPTEAGAALAVAVLRTPRLSASAWSAECADTMRRREALGQLPLGVEVPPSFVGLIAGDDLLWPEEGWLDRAPCPSPDDVLWQTVILMADAGLPCAVELRARQSLMDLAALKARSAKEGARHAGMMIVQRSLRLSREQESGAEVMPEEHALRVRVASLCSRQSTLAFALKEEVHHSLLTTVMAGVPAGRLAADLIVRTLPAHRLGSLKVPHSADGIMRLLESAAEPRVRAFVREEVFHLLESSPVQWDLDTSEALRTLAATNPDIRSWQLHSAHLMPSGAEGALPESASPQSRGSDGSVAASEELCGDIRNADVGAVALQDLEVMASRLPSEWRIPLLGSAVLARRRNAVRATLALAEQRAVASAATAEQMTQLMREYSRRHPWLPDELWETWSTAIGAAQRVPVALALRSGPADETALPDPPPQPSGRTWQEFAALLADERVAGDRRADLHRRELVSAARAAAQMGGEALEDCLSVGRRAPRVFVAALLEAGVIDGADALLNVAAGESDSAWIVKTLVAQLERRSLERARAVRLSGERAQEVERLLWERLRGVDAVNPLSAEWAAYSRACDSVRSRLQEMILALKALEEPLHPGDQADGY